jgi:predicted AlkP superfamily pyrophosphatase or phosphodiesterase
MINSKSLSALKKAQWTSHFNRPLYDSYSFSLIPATISNLLTGKKEKALPPDVTETGKFDAVVLFLIDGFGWKFFEKFQSQYPFLNRFEKSGIASKISSMFPSTTAAHITSINTGLEVAETGIYEWFYYEPIVDQMIAPLLFSYAGDHEGGKLLKNGYKPEEIFPFETIYQRLAKQGVKSIALQQAAIAHSPYSKTLLAGAEILPFNHFTEALEALALGCQTPFEAPTYFFVYLGDIDAMGHRHGIDSPEFSKAVDFCWTSIENRFWKEIQNAPNRIAVMCTADHGMCPVDPKTTVLLNKICPELSQMVKRNKLGQPLVPAGSCRDFFLHIEEDQLQEAHALLTKHLQGIADVFLTQELLPQHFFGSAPVSKRLKDRIGNLVVLPYLGESVFWKFEKHHLEQHFYAAHGGLTPDEMESILLFHSVG